MKLLVSDIASSRRSASPRSINPAPHHVERDKTAASALRFACGFAASTVCRVRP